MEDHAYQVAVHTGARRRFHPVRTLHAALVYSVRAASTDADYIAIEQWSDTASDCTGGWALLEVIRDTAGYRDTVNEHATTALSA